jgi:hypothetical protein
VIFCYKELYRPGETSIVMLFGLFDGLHGDPSLEMTVLRGRHLSWFSMVKLISSNFRPFFDSPLALPTALFLTEFS